MKHLVFRATALALLMAGVSLQAHGHGLVQDPPSRNWFCGAVTKPDEVDNGTAEYPICGEAFADDFNGGYQFMSVLTHTRGRDEVEPLPDNVCGFDSESWSGGETPWDQPIDWPTTEISSGEQTFTWNIEWGPHFGDTEEFHYWITKPDFDYQVGEPLEWSDFESEAFCKLKYDDSNPNANPDIVPEQDNAKFHTTCDVPDRTGRHVIYAEWGRNHYTDERFHGCMDVVINGSGGGNPGGGNPGGGDNNGGGDDPAVETEAQLSMDPNVNEFVGTGSIRLDASGSQGENLSYQWSVDSESPELYTLQNGESSVATLSLREPETAGSVTVTLSVEGANGSDNTTSTISHVPSQTMTEWTDHGQLTNSAQTLNAGDTVRLRVVDGNGQDSYYPQSPVQITAETAGSQAWPMALAEAVNNSAATVRVGVLNDNDEVVPAADATANRVYATNGTDLASAHVEIERATNDGDDDSDGSGDSDDGDSDSGNVACSVDYEVANEWNNGFQGRVTITNNGDTAIEGWELSWEFVNGEQLNHGWNADFSASGSSVTTSNPAGHWNGTLDANGGTVTFGFIGGKSGQDAANAESFELNGESCSS